MKRNVDFKLNKYKFTWSLRCHTLGLALVHGLESIGVSRATSPHERLALVRVHVEEELLLKVTAAADGLRQVALICN